MAAFEYLAIDGDGRTRRGSLSGDSERQVRSRLRELGFHPLEVRVIGRDAARRPGLRLERRVSSAALALLIRRLATLVKAGIPLERALRSLEAQSASRRLKSVLTGVRAQVTEGLSLHQAMASYPGVFPGLYQSMAAAGEASGRLAEVLARLADYAEARRALRRALGMALIYPAILTVAALLVVGVLLTYVIPEVMRVFEQTGADLPPLTVGLVMLSDFLRRCGLMLGAGAVGAALLWRCLLGRQAVRRRWDRLVLGLPVIGRLCRMLNTARLARALAILVNSGMPLLEALETSSRLVDNIPLREAVEAAARRVREGDRLHVSLAESGWFPAMFLDMLAAGEESGELDEMLEQAAAQAELEVETVIAAAASLFEPIVILVMGGIVLLIVLAVLLPIFEMNQLIGA